MSMLPHECRCGTCLREIGAVAQQGEHLHGMQEVQGSIPCRSTNLDEGERAEQEAWGRASAEAFWRVEEELEEAKVSDDMTEDGPTGRALELADLVSDMVWGGERGWERANKEQFAHLKREARKRMKV